MQILFIAGWCVGVAGWFYGARFFLPMWAVGFRKLEKHEGYRRKALMGFAVFLGAALFCFLIGGLAELAGGWE
jgi:4-hydroxybenzoate polyprenyltransferase